MAYEKYNSNGSINEFWVVEQQQIREKKEFEERYKKKLELRRESDLQLYKDRLEETYKFIKEHGEDPAAIQTAKIVFGGKGSSKL